MVQMKLHIRMAERMINKTQLSQMTNIRLNTLSGYYNNNYKHIVNEHIDKIMRALELDNISELIEYIKDEDK